MQAAAASLQSDMDVLVGVDDPRCQHHFVSTSTSVGAVQLHYAEVGSGPLVLLLHGFPDFWYSWRYQMLPLAAAGFRVVALDLRGYNLSDKPEPIAAYGVRCVVDDVLAVMMHLGAERAHLVGHDIGAGVAWAFAMRHPSALGRLCILNGPHPERFVHSLLRTSQLLKSWYVFGLQVPALPEWFLSRNDHAVLIDAVSQRLGGGTWAADDARAYRVAYEQPGALRAMLSYYRAMFRPSGFVPVVPIQADTLVLWGEADPFLVPSLAEPSPHWVPSAQVERVPHAGHFIQHEQPQLVNERLIEFLGRA